jgi:predicted ATPase
LVGRDCELAELRQLLSSDDVRLLTVSGAGGSGKTRLALQVAWDSRDAFPGGTVFVSLAAAADSGAMASAIAAALGVSQGGGASLESSITEHLRREIIRPMLLVLDNVEQLASAASLVGEWLDACACLKLLATSRVALRIYGEHEYPLSPLPVPQCDPLPSLDELARNPAVKLFLLRTPAASRYRELNNDNAPAIAELCCRLDGLPLAIELVAAQAGNLSPASMLARFSGHLDLPVHIARDMPERQRTLRRTLDWSHELLDEAERVLFRRLSVFVNGFTAEGAEAVGDTHGDLEGGVADAIAGLAAKNLIVPLRGEDEPRYTMLETIRKYGMERLAASNEETLARRAHAAYCLVLAEEGNARLSTTGREAWLARCDLEHDNCLAAIAGLLQRDEAGWAMRMGVALFGYWERREHVMEADRQLRAILGGCGPDADPALWVKLVNFTGTIAGIREQTDESRRLIEQALEVSREAGDARGVAACLNSLAVHRQFAGDLPGAYNWYEQSLQTCRHIGDGKEIAGALSNLARNDLLLGSPEVARERLQEALVLFRDAGDPILVAWCLNHLADVAIETGNHSEADQLYRESEAMFRNAGDAWGVARSCTDLGRLAIARDDLAEAGSRFVEALGLFLQLRHRRGVALLLEGCAQLVALQGRAEQALVIAGAAKQLRDTIAVPGRSPQQARLEQALAPILRQTPPAVAQAHLAQGAAMPLATAIGYALEAVQPAGFTEP